MPRFKRLCLSIAGTASVALASLPLAIGPVSAARVPVGTTTSILILEASSNASQFNLGSHRVQGSLTELVGQTKNLKPIASIPTPIGESAGGRTAGGCPSGTVFATGNGGCGGGGIPWGSKPTKGNPDGENQTKTRKESAEKPTAKQKETDDKFDLEDYATTRTK